jgi:hypothetical protein
LGQRQGFGVGLLALFVSEMRANAGDFVIVVSDRPGVAVSLFRSGRLNGIVFLVQEDLKPSGREMYVLTGL